MYFAVDFWEGAEVWGTPKYFNREQNGGLGNVLAKGTPDVSGFNGG